MRTGWRKLLCHDAICCRSRHTLCVRRFDARENQASSGSRSGPGGAGGVRLCRALTVTLETAHDAARDSHLQMQTLDPAG